MPHTTIEAGTAPARQRSAMTTGIIVGGIILVAMSLAGALVLWVKYGTAVFFEIIASGIAACF